MTFAQPFKDYEILDRVGAGAMGTVFKARHKKLGRIVALKVLKPSLARDERYVDRLKREARIVASLNHPNIVTGYDLGEEGGYHYFVMEFVEGKSLRALLTEWGMFAEEYVRRVARQVAMALDHAYQRGVIHRDIKPGNILIDEAGNVKLTDMGLAKGPADLTLTRDGATVGTPQYISPEQARAPQDVDVRSDLYSLGATLYHMATGLPPFRGDTMAAVITKVLNETAAPPRDLNPALSEGTSLVIRKLLAKDLRVRYQTPRELLDDLGRIERRQAPQVDESRLVRAELGPQPSVWLRSLAIVAIAAVLTLGVWLGSRLRADEHTVLAPAELVAALGRELPQLPNPWARWQRLRQVRDDQQLSLAELTPFERRVTQELQAGVDAVAQDLQGSGWRDVEAWLADPARWPDAVDFERERVQEALLRRLGCQREQLPASVSTSALGNLVLLANRAIGERDERLLRLLDIWLTTTLPALAGKRLGEGDFAAAERSWSTALSEFFDGVRQPRLDRLPDPIVRNARSRHEEARTRAAGEIAAAEARLASACTSEVVGVVEMVSQRLDAGADPEQIAAFVERWREQMAAAWPPPGHFRPEADPWPRLEVMVRDCERAVELARVRQADLRQQLRFDLTWRAACSGHPRDALAMLEEVPSASASLLRQVGEHRAALLAADKVATAVLRALQAAPGTLPAFPRTAPATAVEVRVAVDHDRPVLQVVRVGGVAVPAALTEFRFDNLLHAATQLRPDLFRGLQERERDLGCLVLAMIGDDMAGLGGQVRAAGVDFLLQDVWPRILRVREQRGEAPLDRPTLWRNLQAAWRAARDAGDMAPLQGAIAAFDSRFARDVTPAEQAELRAIRAWQQQEVRRRTVMADLRSASRSDQVTVTSAADGSLQATVGVPAAVLRSDASGGFELSGESLVFAGGPRPWGELAAQRLQVDAGVPPGGDGYQAVLDLVLPPATAGTRLYAVEFRSVAVLVAVLADDSVRAAVVDGPLDRGDLAQRAFRDAVDGVIEGRAAGHAIAGAVHRLTIEVAGRGRAVIRVLFENVELCSTVRGLEAAPLPSVTLYPLQEVAVRRVAITATGL